jgi:ER lumen protein retaining receptor
MACAIVSLLWGRRRASGVQLDTSQKCQLARRICWLVVPCVILGIFFNYAPNPLYPNIISGSSKANQLSMFIAESAWATSLYLHAVAFIPQFQMLSTAARTSAIDTPMVVYLLLVFTFRALYLPHWVLRWVP